jgi:hypothetical protein
MAIYTISTKQLRTQLPAIRAGLARGDHYHLIYRSRTVGELRPPHPSSLTPIKLSGGGLQLQSRVNRKLTPEYLNEIAETLYDD